MNKTDTPTRKLAAIMFTDIVGYTALMAEDEHRALQLLQKNLEVLKPLIKQFAGRRAVEPVQFSGPLIEAKPEEIVEKTRVLIIEDESSFTRNVKLNLEQTGAFEVMEETAQNKAVDIGVNEFVTKPLDFEIL